MEFEMSTQQQMYSILYRSVDGLCVIWDAHFDLGLNKVGIRFLTSSRLGN